MSLFGGKSLVDSVDELINLVDKWNVNNCPNNLDSITHKKRSYSNANMDDDSKNNEMPLKRTRMNNYGQKNCLIDLELNAKKEILSILVKIIESKYNVKFSEDDQKKLIFNSMGKPKAGMGEIAIPCFRLTKPLKQKNPKQLAKDLSVLINDEIKSDNIIDSPFDKSEDLNGYINIYLKTAYIGQIVDMILDKNDPFLSKLPRNNQTVMVEYSQPNTHKEFHVGHMRNVALGDCLWRLYDFVGYKSIPVNYFGDEGTHVAKCLWLLKKNIDKFGLNIDDEKVVSPDKRGEFLGNMYTKANNLISLSYYTKLPYPGVITAKILTVNKHPSSDAPPNWNVVTLDIGNGTDNAVTVVCGGSDYNIGDIIAYTPVGVQYKKIIASKKDMKGVISNGVIMGAKELGIDLGPMKVSENNTEMKEDNNTSKKKKKKSKKAKKAKKQTVKDQRIYIVNKDYPNCKLGTSIVELGRDGISDEAKDVISKYVDTNDDIITKVKEFNDEVREILALLENEDKFIHDLWLKTRKWCIDEFHTIYDWLGAQFIHDFCESECSKQSKDMVYEYYNKGVFKESEGCIGIDLGKKLGFCMLLKSNGTGLYATKDLVLARKKFDKYKVDQSIYVVDASQKHHFEQVFGVLDAIGYEQAKKCYHLPYGMVCLPKTKDNPSGKMGSRYGNVVVFSILKKQLNDEIWDKYLNKLKNEQNWSNDELKIAQQYISVGTIKFGMLNHDNNKDIVFDIKKWTLNSGKTGPYLLYQYARIQSIERKLNMNELINIKPDFSLLNSNDEKEILYELSSFQRKIKWITNNKNPSSLCDYMFNIANAFSAWYFKDENNIQRTQDNVLKYTRLLFAKAVGQTLKTGLNLLGLKVLDRM